MAGDMKGAVNTFKTAIQSFPGVGRLWKSLAEVYKIMGDERNTEKVVGGAWKRFPSIVSRWSQFESEIWEGQPILHNFSCEAPDPFYPSHPCPPKPGTPYQNPPMFPDSAPRSSHPTHLFAPQPSIYRSPSMLPGRHLALTRLQTTISKGTRIPVSQARTVWLFTREGARQSSTPNTLRPNGTRSDWAVLISPHPRHTLETYIRARLVPGVCFGDVHELCNHSGLPEYEIRKYFARDHESSCTLQFQGVTEQSDDQLGKLGETFWISRLMIYVTSWWSGIRCSVHSAR
jgi:hypothetical protein